MLEYIIIGVLVLFIFIIIIRIAHVNKKEQETLQKATMINARLTHRRKSTTEDGITYYTTFELPNGDTLEMQTPYRIYQLSRLKISGRLYYIKPLTFVKFIQNVYSFDRDEVRKKY